MYSQQLLCLAGFIFIFIIRNTVGMNLDKILLP